MTSSVARAVFVSVYHPLYAHPAATVYSECCRVHATENRYSVSASRCSQPCHQIENAQDLRPIAYHLPIAHLSPAQHAVPVYYEGRAPGHVAGLVEDAIGADDGAVDVAQEREGESLGLGEGGVRKGAVGADGQERGAALSDLRVDLDQADELRRSNATPVKAVEDEHHVLPSQRRQRDIGPRGGW